MNKENKTLQEVYKNSSLEVQEILLTKFNNAELGLEIDKEQFKEHFLELLSNYKSIRFLDNNSNESNLPTKRYQLCDENNEWLFEIDLNTNMVYFWYSYHRIFKKLQSRFGYKCGEINWLINGILNETTELNGLTPFGWY